jgi:hypothetical protein
MLRRPHARFAAPAAAVAALALSPKQQACPPPALASPLRLSRCRGVWSAGGLMASSGAAAAADVELDEAASICACRCTSTRGRVRIAAAVSRGRRVGMTAMADPPPVRLPRVLDRPTGSVALGARNPH